MACWISRFCKWPYCFSTSVLTRVKKVLSSALSSGHSPMAVSFSKSSTLSRSFGKASASASLKRGRARRMSNCRSPCCINSSDHSLMRSASISSTSSRLLALDQSACEIFTSLPLAGEGGETGALVAALPAIFEPIVIPGMGLVVLSTILVVLLPIFDLNQLFRQLVRHRIKPRMECVGFGREIGCS